MGTSLNGLTPQNTYQGLLKTTDNTALSTTLKTVSDGQGNDTPLKVATDKVEIGNVSYTELQYLDGVTSGIQTQLNGKENTITGAASTIVSSNLTVSRALVANASGKVDVSTVTSTELGHVSGVTSAIQTQLNGKEATITGGATSITSSNLTTSRALVSDGSGKVAVSSVTSTELGHVSGVTSGIQTQINNKISKSVGSTYTVNDLLALTQAEYDAIGTKSATTLYFII